MRFLIILRLQGGRGLCSLAGGAQEAEELLVANVGFPPPNITTSGLSSKSSACPWTVAGIPPLKGGWSLPSSLRYLLGLC